jgi:hypothetical protein
MPRILTLAGLSRKVKYRHLHISQARAAASDASVPRRACRTHLSPCPGSICKSKPATERDKILLQNTIDNGDHLFGESRLT